MERMYERTARSAEGPLPMPGRRYGEGWSIPGNAKPGEVIIIPPLGKEHDPWAGPIPDHRTWDDQAYRKFEYSDVTIAFMVEKNSVMFEWYAHTFPGGRRHRNQGRVMNQEVMELRRLFPEAEMMDSKELVYLVYEVFLQLMEESA